MPITDFPTRTVGSLGPTKSNRYAVQDISRQHDMSEYNVLADRVIQLFEEVGKTDGSTGGSLREAILAIIARRPFTFTVGNDLEGDLENQHDFIDPGDGTGVEAAIAAMPASGGVIRVRRGTFSRGPDAGAIEVPSKVILSGEGEGKTIFVAPYGSSTSEPWRTFDVTGGEISDITIQANGADPTFPESTTPIPIVALRGLRAKARRVLVEITGSLPVKGLGPCAAFRIEEFNGGWLMDECKVDARTATFANEPSAIPIGLVCLTSGNFSGGDALILREPGYSRGKVRGFEILGGPNDPPVSYGGTQTWGVVMTSVMDFVLDGFDFDGLGMGYFGYWFGPASGTVDAVGPTIKNGRIEAAPDLPSSYFPSGIVFFIQDLGGTFNIHGLYVSDVDCHGAETGNANPGFAFSIDADSVQDFNAIGLSARAHVTGISSVFSATMNGSGNTFREIKLFPGPAADTSLSISGTQDYASVHDIVAGAITIDSGITNSSFSHIQAKTSMTPPDPSNSYSNIKVG